jgi:hypothetical protein
LQYGGIYLRKTRNLEEWACPTDFNSETLIEVNIHLLYTDYNQILAFTPSERKKKIREEQKTKFKELLASNLFKSYTIIGTPGKPRGVKVNVPFSALKKFEEMDSVEHIFINKIDNCRGK